MDKFQYFDNITFSDMWSTADSFVETFKEVGFPQTYKLADKNANASYVTDDDLKLIWLLLTGRFADSTIKPYNTYGGFKVRFMSKVWQYAPGWKKELEIQNTLRALSLAEGSEIYEGSKAIYNNAMNPGTAVATEELNFINSQNTTKHKRSKLEGIALLADLMKKDVTEEFLRRFDDFFKTIIFTGNPVVYETYPN